MVSRFMVLFASLIFCISSAAHSETLWKVEGFAQPESTVFDGVKKRIIVTNMDGDPTKADGKGFLSLVSLDGKMIKREWGSGLDAPKGIALLGRELIVADLTKVHVVDADSGKVIRSIQVDGAKFLNDVAVGEGEAWITDMMGHSIYRYKDGKVSLWLNDKGLSYPNGILVDGKRLLIASWGKDLQKDFTTKVPGSLLAVDSVTKAISSVSKGERIGNLDGIVRIEDKLIVNDWINGAVYELQEGQQVKKVLSLASGLADIAGNGDMLFFPFMKDGVLEAYRYR